MGHIHGRDEYLGDSPQEWATRRLLPSEPIYISTREVCLVLGVSRGTVAAWIKGGLCPALQVGGPGSNYRVPASWLVDVCRKGLEYREQA